MLVAEAQQMTVNIQRWVFFRCRGPNQVWLIWISMVETIWDSSWSFDRISGSNSPLRVLRAKKKNVLHAWMLLLHIFSFITCEVLFFVATVN